MGIAEVKTEAVRTRTGDAKEIPRGRILLQITALAIRKAEPDVSAAFVNGFEKLLYIRKFHDSDHN